MYWVYVLECNRYKEYIGLSKQLYIRHEQHISGNGAIFTQKYEPIKSIVLYKVKHNIMYKEYSKLLQKYGSRTQINKQHFKKSTLMNFFRKFNDDDKICNNFNLKSEAEDLENEITILRNLISIYADNGICNIRGGNWHQPDKKYKSLEKECENFIYRRPLCKCGQYTELETEWDYLYFVCPYKNYFVREECNIKRYCNFKLRITEHNNYYRHQWDDYDGYISDSQINNYDSESDYEFDENINPLIECITDEED